MTYLSTEMDGLALDSSRTEAGGAAGGGRAAPTGYALVTVSILCVFALLGLGIVMLYSVTEASGSMARVQRQTLYALAGIGALMVALRVPYDKVCKASWFFYAAALAALVVLLFVGHARKGAVRWFALGPMTVQPSEFARLALIWILARYLSVYHERMHELLRGVLVPLLLIGVPCGLVILQPDFGMTALIGSVGVTMLFVGGYRLRFLALAVLLAGAGFFVLVRSDKERWDRVSAFLGLDAAARDEQAEAAESALKAGGPAGRGLGNSFHKYKYLPEADNDFIFPIIGEELGLPATLGIVAAFFLLTAGGAVVALRAPDLMGLLLATGLTFNLCAQALLNMAVVTRLIPNKGLPLPFISAGGSNLLMQMAAIGMLLNIYVASRRLRARRGDADEMDEVDW